MFQVMEGVRNKFGVVGEQKGLGLKRLSWIGVKVWDLDPHPTNHSLKPEEKDRQNTHERTRRRYNTMCSSGSGLTGKLKSKDSEVLVLDSFVDNEY